MCIKAGTITVASGTSGNNGSGSGKKSYSSGFIKKQEGEESNAFVDKGKASLHIPYYQTPVISP